jgi:hypothetical protein
MKGFDWKIMPPPKDDSVFRKLKVSQVYLKNPNNQPIFPPQREIPCKIG